MRLEDRVVLVTGASSGIGAATAEEMARRRVRAVVIVARRADALERVAHGVESSGSTALVFPCDLSDPDAVSRMAREVEAATGAPDVLVNNAGAGRWLFPWETAPEEAASMMAVPYFAAFNVTRAFLPAMIGRGSGHIVNLSSPACYMCWPGATAYCTARWAMRGFTAALRADLGGSGVRTSLLVPGKVATEYFGNNPGSEERIPGIARIYRTLSAREVAEAVAHCIVRDKREFVVPFLLRATVWVHRFAPRVVESLVTRTGAARTL